MSLLGDARTLIAEALSPVQATIYAYPAEAVYPPAVMIVLDEPWAEVKGIGTRLRMHARLKLQLAVSANNNLGAVEKLEDLIQEVLVNLPSGCIVGAVSAPTIQSVGTSELPIVEIPVIVPVADL